MPRFAWSAATSPTHRDEAAVSSGAFVSCDLCVLSVSSQSQLVTAVYVATFLFVVVALFLDEHVWVSPLFLRRNCACVFSLSGKGITATCYGIAAVARALSSLSTGFWRNRFGVEPRSGERQSSPFFPVFFSFLEETFSPAGQLPV